jgi:hypothetical protein
MKKNLLFCGLLILCFKTFSQEKNFDVFIGLGRYSTPKYRPVSGGNCFDGGFEYSHSKRWAFATDLILTRYSSKLESSSIRIASSGIPIQQRWEHQTNFMVKYKFVNTSKITFQIGAGLGLTTMGRVDEINPTPTSWSSIYTSNSDLGFPISAEIFTHLNKHFLVEMKAGSFIFPDYPIIGNNLSLQIRY